jgi:hypothetical protein
MDVPEWYALQQAEGKGGATITADALAVVRALGTAGSGLTSDESRRSLASKVGAM